MSDIPKWPEFTVIPSGQQDSDGVYPNLTVEFLDDHGRKQTFIEVFPDHGMFYTNYEATNAAKRIKVLSVSKTGVISVAPKQS